MKSFSEFFKIATGIDNPFDYQCRSACDLELDGEIQVKRPSNISLPALEEIENELPELIKQAYSDDKTDRRITLKADLEKIKKSSKEGNDEE